MEKPIYTIHSCVNEEKLRKGIRAGQRRWAAWVFAFICSAAAAFGVIKIVRADNLDDMYTWIVCVLFGIITAFPAFTAGKRQENDICASAFERCGSHELRQKIQFYGDRLEYSEPKKAAATILYKDTQKLAELDNVIAIISQNRSQVFIDRESIPEGLDGFLKENIAK